MVALTDKQAKALKAKKRPYKAADARGLFLLVHPNGGKYWRLKYRYAAKEKTLALGVYPEVGLRIARRRRDEAKQALAEGIDPGAQRRAEKAATADTFEGVAREWYTARRQSWAESYRDKVLARLENDLIPYLGSRPVADIKAPELLQVLRRVESRGAVETAYRELRIAGQVFRYAVATGKAERDPSGDLKGALKPHTSTHLASITDPAEVGALLRAIDGFAGTFPVQCALRLAPLVFVRPGELRKAEWAEVDLASATWEIPAERMKMKTSHVVPLSTQAVAILKELEPLTGRGRYVFPGGRTAARPMSENALTAALRRMGYAQGTMTAHGFRAMARTLLDERLGFRVDYIEHQLAHEVRDPLGRAYNRTKHLKERRAMMQAWADYLDGLKQGGNVVALRGHKAQP